MRGKRPVAIYHFHAKVISRGQGRGIVAAAAYRAGECLFDNELGRSQNFLAKDGVVHKAILLPDGAPNRWLDRETLWNEVAAMEPAREATPDDDAAKNDPDPRKRPRYRQLAREVEFSLPRELSQVEAIRLAEDFVHEQFVARGMVADLAVHWVKAADGHIQPHAHVLLTLRSVDPTGRHRVDDRPGLGRPRKAKAEEMRMAMDSSSARAGFGLKERAWNERALIGQWRERWAEMVNVRLAVLGHDMRVDHRSNAARGLNLEPGNKIGPAASRRARKGTKGDRAAEHRAIARRNGDRLLADPELALQALTQQQSTFTQADLARLIHRQSDDGAQYAAIMAKVEASPELVQVGQDGRGLARFSTVEMVRVEHEMIAAAIALNRRATHRVDVELRRAPIEGGTLKEEQRHAFGHVTRSRDLAVVIGIAGGGKSTMLGAARAAWAAQGYEVRGAALSGIAAEGLEGSAGIRSRTIASWEYAWAQNKEMLTASDVLVVDEAGMVGSRQLERLLRHAREAGAKLVLVGDAEQLQAIEAGAAFRAIAERVGSYAITEPQRHYEPWQRLATKELATARTGEALARYEAVGMVHRHATRDAAHGGLIMRWDEARRQSPQQSQIILAHERVDVRLLNEAARTLRRAAGELGVDHAVQTELGPRAFAEGDRLYFLKNERGLGVKNGTLGTIERLETGAHGLQFTVRLDGPGKAGTGQAVNFDLDEYAQIDHGYAATIHKSQGVTVDQAHMLATPGIDRHLTYVAMSRHRHGVQLHWGEDEFGRGLAAVLGRERAKDTTLDYGEPEPDPVAAYADRRSLIPALPGIFDGLQLSAEPVSEQHAPGPPQPEATPLAQAVSALLSALNTRTGMTRKGLPVLPHQEAAVGAAADNLEALRPGSVGDLSDVARQQSDLVTRAMAEPAGMVLLIAAIEHRPADRKAEQEAKASREAEDAARRSEHELLVPARARLLRERMAVWWRTKYPYAQMSDYSRDARQAEAKDAERILRAEIERMPGADLRRIAAKLERADQQAAQEAAVRPRPGPSPSPF